MTAHRFLLAALLAGAFVSASAQDAALKSDASDHYRWWCLRSGCGQARAGVRSTRPGSTRSKRLAGPRSMRCSPSPIRWSSSTCASRRNSSSSAPSPCFSACRTRISKSNSPGFRATAPSSPSPITRNARGAAADLLTAKGFKVAGATGAEDEVAGGTTVAHLLPRRRGRRCNGAEALIGRRT